MGGGELAPQPGLDRGEGLHYATELISQTFAACGHMQVELAACGGSTEEVCYHLTRCLLHMTDHRLLPLLQDNFRSAGADTSRGRRAARVFSPSDLARCVTPDSSSFGPFVARQV